MQKRNGHAQRGIPLEKFEALNWGCIQCQLYDVLQFHYNVKIEHILTNLWGLDKFDILISTSYLGTFVYGNELEQFFHHHHL